MIQSLAPLLAAIWLNATIAGLVVGVLVAAAILLSQKKASRHTAAAATARDAGLAVQRERAEEALPEGLGLENVAVLNLGRARRVWAVATGEHAGRTVTTFGLRLVENSRSADRVRRYVAVHLADAVRGTLHAVSLPDDALAGILEAFGNVEADAPRTVRGNDAEAAAAWASRPALLEAAGGDALVEVGPAGFTLLVPGDPADRALLLDAMNRALHAAD